MAVVAGIAGPTVGKLFVVVGVALVVAAALLTFLLEESAGFADEQLFLLVERGGVLVVGETIGLEDAAVVRTGSAVVAPLLLKKSVYVATGCGIGVAYENVEVDMALAASLPEARGIAAALARISLP